VVNGVAKKQPTDDRAPSSERAYAADWRDFCAFVARLGRARLSAEAETVALYVADLKRRGRRPATIAGKLAAISTRCGASSLNIPNIPNIPADPRSLTDTACR